MLDESIPSFDCPVAPLTESLEPAVQDLDSDFVQSNRKEDYAIEKT
jgi:hypothetical protein